MNIFYLDHNVKKCAEYHVDRHCVKMLVEYTQLLSSTYYFTNQSDIAPYKLTHKNHPSAIWTRESLSNWLWLRDLGLSLYDEYKHRYNNKIHKSGEVIKALQPPKLIDIGITPMRCAMGDEYLLETAVESYRNYYKYGKQHLLKWTNREIPWWIREVV